MRPDLVTDDFSRRSPVVPILRSITASTLAADIPSDMAALLALLDIIPDQPPPCRSPVSGPATTA